MLKYMYAKKINKKKSIFMHMLYLHNMYKMIVKFSDMMDNNSCTHMCQTYLTELSIFKNLIPWTHLVEFWITPNYSTVNGELRDNKIQLCIYFAAYGCTSVLAFIR